MQRSLEKDAVKVSSYTRIVDVLDRERGVESFKLVMSGILNRLLTTCMRVSAGHPFPSRLGSSSDSTGLKLESARLETIKLVFQPTRFGSAYNLLPLKNNYFFFLQKWL